NRADADDKVLSGRQQSFAKTWPAHFDFLGFLIAQVRQPVDFLPRFGNFAHRPFQVTELTLDLLRGFRHFRQPGASGSRKLVNPECDTTDQATKNDQSAKRRRNPYACHRPDSWAENKIEQDGENDRDKERACHLQCEKNRQNKKAGQCERPHVERLENHSQLADIWFLFGFRFRFFVQLFNSSRQCHDVTSAPGAEIVGDETGRLYLRITCYGVVLNWQKKLLFFNAKARSVLSQ